MDILNLILDVAQPSGFWASIINAFESGLGSYLLAIILITLILRVILSPFDMINKRMTKKQMAAQAAIQPEVEKIQKKYANDKNLLNQKMQALYKKTGARAGGSCLFMIVFMAINLTVFFTLLSSLNAMSDYKINQQYLGLKESYANVLNLIDENSQNTDSLEFLNSYNNITLKVEESDSVKYLRAYSDDVLLFESKYKDLKNFEKYTPVEQTFSDISAIIQNYNQDSEYTQLKVVTNEGEAEVTTYYYVKTDQITKQEDKYILNDGAEVYSYQSSDEVILNLVRKYTQKEEVKEGEESKQEYFGDKKLSEELTVKDAVLNLSMQEVNKAYKASQKENSFLWIGSIWVADSPFKSSIFTFDEYKAEIGAKNLSSQEEAIYTSFMGELKNQKGRVNGYLILAIISIAVGMLSMWLGQLGQTPKGVKQPKSSKVLMFIMPIIMGIFAVFYNSVFAIYLFVSQVASAAISPLNNYIVKKWEQHDEKKKAEKQPQVDYRRK